MIRKIFACVLSISIFCTQPIAAQESITSSTQFEKGEGLLVISPRIIWELNRTSIGTMGYVYATVKL